VALVVVAFLPWAHRFASGRSRLASAVGFGLNSGRPDLSVNKVSAVRLREAKVRLSYRRGGEELK
jgi:hypothetical protein